MVSGLKNKGEETEAGWVRKEGISEERGRGEYDIVQCVKFSKNQWKGKNCELTIMAIIWEGHLNPPCNLGTKLRITSTAAYCMDEGENCWSHTVRFVKLREKRLEWYFKEEEGLRCHDAPWKTELMECSADHKAPETVVRGKSPSRLMKDYPRWDDQL